MDYLQAYCRKHGQARVSAALALTVASAAVVHAPVAQAQGEIAYTVEIAGTLGQELRETLLELSESVQLREERPPASVIHLRRRAERDREEFLALLHSRGHYRASVNVQLDDKATPITLAFEIQAGPRYVLKHAGVKPAEPAPPDAVALPTTDDLGLMVGEPFEAQPVLDAEERVLERLREQGHAFAAIADREVIVDHADQTVSVTLEVDPGPRTFFGPVTVEGLETVREAVVRKHVEWQEREPYDARLVVDTQNELYRTGLFSLVRVDRAVDEPVDGTVPMVIEVAERKHRTIAAGVQYRTDEGAGLRLHWEHRNIRGLGRLASVDANIGQTQTSLEARYKLRRWRRDNQTLELAAHAGVWSPDAYTSQRIGTSAFVGRQLTERWSAGTGLSLRWDDIEQSGDSTQYKLLSMPWRATFDNTNDLLDPTSGRRLSLRAEPFAGLGGGSLTFLKGETTYSEYFALDDGDRWLLAVRARLGMLGGAAQGDVPPDERFYAGGAASIRGYAYQSVGPVDEDDDPLGGRSVFDMSVELRRKITESIGVVVFVDGGSAYREPWPEFTDVRFGAGVGLRYFTPIGPVGLDVAVPLNKREFDDGFQVYVTLGQAF